MFDLVAPRREVSRKVKEHSRQKELHEQRPRGKRYRDPGLNLHLVSAHSLHMPCPQSSSCARFRHLLLPDELLVILLRKYKEAWFAAKDQGGFKASFSLCSDHPVPCSIYRSMKSEAESFNFIVLKKKKILDGYTWQLIREPSVTSQLLFSHFFKTILFI